MRQDQQQVSSDHPEAVRSAPVPVPGVQPPAHGGRDAEGRADVPEDVLDERGTFDDPAGAGERSDGRWDGQRPDADGTPEFHEPAPLPSAFGATSVGDAVAASAMASGRAEDERDPRGEDTAQPGDGAPGRTDEFDDVRADPTAADRLHDPARWAAGTPTAARHDRPGEAREAGEASEASRAGQAGEAGGAGEDRRAERDTRAAVAAGAAGYGSATPTMVDPDATAPNASAAAGAGVTGTAGTGTAGTGTAGTGTAGTGTAGTGTAGTGTAGTGTAGGRDGGVVAAARPTGRAVPHDAATLFEPDAAQGFRDRWREVQLRFVDDPKAAAAEAQSLVEEAIQALAAALAEQKNRLGDWQRADADDTEQLRVAVRRYRDFLDRVLGR
ncbi:hypothetical protein GCM10010429_00050 [Micromonospora olivasterospora]|uniref:hypothetical protein n=1 Tax=Micromonospora olivasterospora TaxID=1880 RepID=UPI0031E0EFEE